MTMLQAVAATSVGGRAASGSVSNTPTRRVRPKVHPNTLKRVRLAVYRRDGFRCCLCGWSPPVPDGYDGRYALGAKDDRPGRRPYAIRLLELDHIHPFKLGGRFEVDNLQTLCNNCNARKGARV